MALVPLDIGLLFSTTGSYRALGGAMLAGAKLAVAEITADPDLPVEITCHVRNPNGLLSQYVGQAQELLRDSGLTHVVGCYTSASRKEVLPLFEKFDGLLWYPSHYEGFETSDNAIYTGAAPNQHIVPLTRYMLQNHGKRAWLVGSNYIWAWENHRIMREGLLLSGGAILGERYFPIGDTDIDALVEQILASRPDFIFNNLIGESSYAFFRRLRARAEAQGLNQAEDMPVISCSLSEPELREIGPDAAGGHLCSSVYFESLESATNKAFVEAWRHSYPELGPTSADAETTYNAVHLLARAAAAAGSAELSVVRRVVSEIVLNAPQGRIHVDPENRHCHLRPRIGRSTPKGEFELVYEAPAPVKPDPYLVWEGSDVALSPSETGRLRLV
ncbi:transporter substrate-binding domain-containing protein [Algihabitans albus]|uniref:transporter substrate-binding domain-containing protein n=1 Tax=Algihabitans albus TaxID=2164067 RepID=UPI000E5D3605|nr:transporter substrate-binding domain-containing protein [Algihabitans albus]